MLYSVSVLLTIISLMVLVIRPYQGVLILLMSKPIIDTGYYKVFAYGLSITRVLAVLVPFLIILAAIRATQSASISRMPLKTIWIVYVTYIFIFSLFVIINTGILDGIEVFFRHVHGFVGFYMIQAYFHDREKLRGLLRALLIAGLFPVGVGVYQMVTGQALSPHAGGDIVEGLQRQVGFYHDVFTVRYYALQTLFVCLLYWAIFLPKVKIKALSLIGYATTAMGVVFKAYSKAGMTTLALWGLIWTVLQRKYLQFAVIAGVAAVIGVYFSDTIVADIERLFRKEIGAIEGELSVEQTFEGRWYGWYHRLEYWSTLGVMRQFFGSGVLMIGAHNDYIQMLFHGGILGLGLYVGLLATIGVRISRNLVERVEPLSVGALMLYIMYLIDTIGLVPSSYVGYQWLVWGFIGLSFRIRADQRSSGRAWIARGDKAP